MGIVRVAICDNGIGKFDKWVGIEKLIKGKKYDVKMILNGKFENLFCGRYNFILNENVIVKNYFLSNLGFKFFCFRFRI